ncbi:MAG: septum formation initiator family protein [Saccharospirillum sp.]|nr:septum formation initiator family protein [Saccharospirillum sp.]
MRVLQLGLLLLFCVLQYRYWLADNGWRDVQRLQGDIAQQELYIERQQQRNATLEARVEDLKSGLDAVEELARSNLGLVKPGEVFYVTPMPGAP